MYFFLFRLFMPLRPVSNVVPLPCRTQLIEFGTAVARRLKRALLLSAAHNLLLLILPKCSVLLVHFNVFKTHISKHILNLWHITNIVIIILILLLLSLLLLLLLLCCVKRKPIWPTLKKRTVL